RHIARGPGPYLRPLLPRRSGPHPRRRGARPGVGALDRSGPRRADHGRQRAREGYLLPRPPAAGPATGLEPSNPRLILPSHRAAGSAAEGRGAPPMTLGLSKGTPATARALPLVGGSFAPGRATRATNPLAATDEPARATAPEAPTATRAGGQAPPSFAPLAAGDSPAVVHIKGGSVGKATEDGRALGLPTGGLGGAERRVCGCNLHDL